MNDLINRKGAINAVCTVLYPDADKMNDAKKVLKEMPSARSEIIRCKECKHFHYDMPYVIQGIPVLGHDGDVNISVVL